MTTHYQKIQALGNRMASNLETMGVSASFNDGGLTLADKILEINKFTTGVLLSVDKPIEQSSNTINFTALVLKDGVAEAGKKVHFKGVYTNEITISSSSSNVDLGENGWIITLTGGTAKIGTLSKLLHITKTSSGYNVGVQSAGTTTNLQGSYVYYDGSSKILYSDVAYLDLSNASGIDQVDFTNLYSADSTFGTIGGVVRLPLYATTNSYGVATATYTCSGAGKLTVQALCGSVVSQPYEVLDCTYIDDTEQTSGKTYNVDIGSTGFALEFDINLSATNSQGYFRVGTDNNNCLVIGAIYSTQQGIRVMKSGSDVDHIYCSTRIPVEEDTHIKFTYNNGVMTYNDGDETITITNTETTVSKLLNMGQITSTISNVRLYPI